MGDTPHPLQALLATPDWRLAELLSGGDVRHLQHILGHTPPAMTLRFIRRLPAHDTGQMDNVAKGMGLVRPRIKAQKGGP